MKYFKNTTNKRSSIALTLILALLIAGMLGAMNHESSYAKTKKGEKVKVSATCNYSNTITARWSLKGAKPNMEYDVRLYRKNKNGKYSLVMYVKRTGRKMTFPGSALKTYKVRVTPNLGNTRVSKQHAGSSKPVKTYCKLPGIGTSFKGYSRVIGLKKYPKFTLTNLSRSSSSKHIVYHLKGSQKGISLNKLEKRKKNAPLNTNYKTTVTVIKATASNSSRDHIKIKIIATPSSSKYSSYGRTLELLQTTH